MVPNWLNRAQVGSCRVREAGRAAGAARHRPGVGARCLLLSWSWNGLRYRRPRDSIARLRILVRARRVRDDRVGGRLGGSPCLCVAAAAARGLSAGGASRGAGWWCRELTLYCVSILRPTQPEEQCPWPVLPDSERISGPRECRGARLRCVASDPRATHVAILDSKRSTTEGKLSRCRRPDSNRRGAARATRGRETAPAPARARTSPASSSWAS